MGPVLAAALFAFLVVMVVLDRASVLLLLIYGVLSVVAVLLYRIDKSAATNGGRRIPETNLHVVAVLGGWPGAAVARRIFRHKTRKQPFRTIFWCTVAINCAALGWLLFARHPW